VAVLVRRFRYARIFQKTIVEAGWPVRLAQEGSPLDYAEGRGLLAAFCFLYGLEPELNLAAALRSPLGPVTDEVLLRLALPPEESAARVRLTDYFSSSHPWPTGLAPDDLEILIEVKTLFNELAPLVGRLQPVEILERLVEERRLLPLAAMEPDGEARARALTGFLAVSRTLGRTDDFQNPAEELAKLGRNQRGRSGLEHQDEAITLSTVHGAKGLEFPVVVIAESDYTPQVKASRILTAGDGRLALNWRPAGWSTPPASYLELAAEEDRLEKMENQRLFYVAATRARDHLVFLGRPKSKEEVKGKKVKADTWLQDVLDCPEAVALSEELILDEISKISGPVPAPGVEARPPGQYADLLAPTTLAGASLSVTELAHWLAAGSDFDDPLLPETSEDFQIFASAPDKSVGLSMTPREAGLLFHAVMEILDPREPYPRELLVAEAARLGLPLENPDTLAGPIEVFLKSPWGLDWLEAVSAGRAVFREKPFQLRLRESGGPARCLTVNGVIDLFFQTPGEGRIVDYKFAAFPGESGDRESGELTVYESQVRLYALALRSSGLAGDLKALLYFAGGPRPHFHEVDLETGWTLDFWENFFEKFFNEARTSKLRL
jgi:ATP-dependent exoDNAse (exonuclease V) beta subunit